MSAIPNSVKMSLINNVVAVFFIGLLSFAQPVHAYESPWQGGQEAQARLVVAGVAGATKDNVEMGLQLKLSPGWHTYWRSPGGGGIAPDFTLSEEGGLHNLQILWPAPERFVVEAYGERTIYNGYQDEVFIPLTAQRGIGKNISFTLNVNYALCNAVCIPASAEFKVDLKGDYQDSVAKELFDKALRSVPTDPANSDITFHTSTLQKVDDKNWKLTLSAQSQKPFHKPDIFIETSDSMVMVGEPTVGMVNANKTLQASVTLTAAQTTRAPTINPLTVTIVDGVSRFESKVEVQVQHLEDDSPQIAYGLVLLFALLGGLILNIMPCVLPVLSLKFLGVIKSRGQELSQIRIGFLASALGIVTSFLLLAGVTILFRYFGMAVGWGFHFQEPEFLIVLVIILTLFSTSLLGGFDIHIPQSLERFVVGPARVEKHLVEHFFTGMLATVLATPCTAPFLGTAVSFALSQGAFDIVLIFSVMGIGLALPYLIVSAFPQMVRLLPKPGAWMNNFKKLLGALLFGTAIWLLWILSFQISVRAAIVLFLFCLLLKFVIQPQHAWMNKRFIKWPLVLLVVSGMFVLPSLMQKQMQEQQANVSRLWNDFNESQIESIIKTGRVVVVDITAEWCVVCKTNELLVLNRPDVMDHLDSPNIVLMRGDWTNKSETIRLFLKKHGVYGIPLLVVYGPSHPQGIVLTGILTRSVLYQAIREAQKPILRT